MACSFLQGHFVNETDPNGDTSLCLHRHTKENGHHLFCRSSFDAEPFYLCGFARCWTAVISSSLFLRNEIVFRDGDKVNQHPSPSKKEWECHFLVEFWRSYERGHSSKLAALLARPGLEVLQGEQWGVVDAERVWWNWISQRLLEGIVLELNHQPVGLLTLCLPLLRCLSSDRWYRGKR